MHLRANCTTTLSPDGNEIVCPFPPDYPLDVYFHPQNGSQSKVATCNSPEFDIFNDEGFSCKAGNCSCTIILVPTKFKEPGKFFCQTFGIGMHSEYSMPCNWPPNGNNSLFGPDAAKGNPTTLILSLVLGIGLLLLVFALLSFFLISRSTKNKQQISERTPGLTETLLAKERDGNKPKKIETEEDESHSTPAGRAVRLRNNLTTNAPACSSCQSRETLATNDCIYPAVNDVHTNTSAKTKTEDTDTLEEVEKFDRDVNTKTDIETQGGETEDEDVYSYPDFGTDFGVEILQ